MESDGDHTNRKPRSMGAATVAFVGLVWVNGPVAACLFGVPLATWSVFPNHPGVMFAACAVGLGLAWLAWSYNVPRWRLWAYARADDLGRLKTLAQQLGIVWPDGHFFERTELRSPTYDEELRKTLAGRGLLDPDVDRQR